MRQLVPYGSAPIIVIHRYTQSPPINLRFDLLQSPAACLWKENIKDERKVKKWCQELKGDGSRKFPKDTLVNFEHQSVAEVGTFVNTKDTHFLHYFFMGTSHIMSMPHQISWILPTWPKRWQPCLQRDWNWQSTQGGTNVCCTQVEVRFVAKIFTRSCKRHYRSQTQGVTNLRYTHNNDIGLGPFYISLFSVRKPISLSQSNSDICHRAVDANTIHWCQIPEIDMKSGNGNCKCCMEGTRSLL